VAQVAERNRFKKGERLSGAALRIESRGNFIHASIFTGFLGAIELSNGFGTNELEPDVFRFPVPL
jgi:hypothetical protein